MRDTEEVKDRVTSHSGGEGRGRGRTLAKLLKSWWPLLLGMSDRTWNKDDCWKKQDSTQ